MDTSHLDPFSAAGSRTKQVQDAKDMQQIVLERANRARTAAPPYEFLELIGKGSFGRVYKCKHRESREIVAVKIIDVDELDYKLDNKLKDEAIEDFIKEVNTLKQVRDSNAKNINQIREAFDLHSQLWIVSDYCSGGSVHTLMKASDEPGLEERYIIPIARELAIALMHVHDAGVIHRDIKCGNVLISEDGRLQLCDFGVAARMENDMSKRSTIIGTPYWMAPEMHDASEDGYGQEIDCWAYGCTIFEMATGMPPYHNFHVQYLRQVLRSVPRLDDDHNYSEGLKDFVAFCLQQKPEDRPKAKQIMEHPYIANTEEEYPTSSLRGLIDRYIQWERKGGQRMSLFNAMGAAAPSLVQQHEASEDNWIFSTTADFDKGYEQRYSRLLSGIASMDFAEKTPESLPAEIELPSGPAKELSPLEQAKEEQKASRGERYLERLFDAEKDPYDYDETKMDEDVQPLSDLPLRNLSNDRSANRETLIDLDTSGLDMPPTFNFDFSDMPTLKANRKSSMPHLGDMDDDYHNSQGQATKRATKDWKFPGFAVNGSDGAKRATKDWKFPSFSSDGGNETAKRATKDWKFPDFANTTAATNRRTQDWTFANAMAVPETESDPEYSLSAPTIEEEPFRPGLIRTATEPASKAWDLDHPRQLSLDAAMAQNRDSRPVIDLDMGNEYTPSLSFDHSFNEEDLLRPSSAMSAAPSLASITPFDLEQDPDRRAEDAKRFSHKRLPGSTASLSVAERRMSRAQQLRQSSLGDNLMAPRARGASVDSSASSLVDEASDESAFGRKYNRSMNVKMRDQLRVGLQRSASHVERHSRNLTDESYGDADTDGPYTTNGTYHRFNGSNSTVSYDTDSSFQDEPRLATVPNSFPQIVLPNTAALLDGASQDKMMEELDKILDSAEQALSYTGAVLRSREIELEGAQIVDSATEGPLDMTSEEERELANFS